MKRIVESQPTRKRLWWLIFLLPVVYVIIDGLIYPIDEGSLSKAKESKEIIDISPPRVSEPRVDRPRESVSIPENGDEDAIEGLTGWEIYDMVWVRVEKAWPVILSALAFFFRRKLVGDPR